jgi:hypothetical protein
MWWSARVHAQPKKLKDELSRVDNSPYHLIMDDCTRSNTKASVRVPQHLTRGLISSFSRSSMVLGATGAAAETASCGSWTCSVKT